MSRLPQMCPIADDPHVSAHGPSPEGRSRSLVQRIIAVRERIIGRSPRTERVLLALAVAIFVPVTIAAYANLPASGNGFRPMWLAAAGVAAVATVTVNAGEFAISAALLGKPTSVRRALRVSVLASAANTLPIPGAILVKTQALRQDGHRYRAAFTTSAAIGVVWVAVAATITGGLLIPATSPALGAALLAAGLTGLATGWLIIKQQSQDLPPLRAFCWVVGVEIGSVCVGAARMYLLVRAIGYAASPSQAFSLITAGVVASAAGIFPGGLGLRELLSAGIGAAVDLSRSVAVLASAMDRVVSSSVLLILSGSLLLADRRLARGQPHS